MSRLEIILLFTGAGVVTSLTFIAVSLIRFTYDFRVSIQDAANRQQSANRAEAIGIIDNHAPLPAGLLRPDEDDFAKAEQRRIELEKKARKTPYG